MNNSYQKTVNFFPTKLLARDEEKANMSIINEEKYSLFKNNTHCQYHYHAKCFLNWQKFWHIRYTHSLNFSFEC